MEVTMAIVQRDLQAEIRRHQWYHRIDLGNGIVTPGRDYENVLWKPTRAFMKEVDFQGKRVLDIGCWDGMFSFYAEGLGAAEVIATDIVPRPTLELAASILRSGVRFQQGSAYHLHRMFPANSFDIVIFNGVLYHLMAPMVALVAINWILKPNGTLLLESAYYTEDNEKPVIYVAQGADLLHENDPSSCTFPSVRGFRNMFELAAFSVRREHCYYPKRPTGRVLFEVRKREKTVSESLDIYEHGYNLLLS
jgi:tRNA (mo5U34)-methyltransferase